MNDISGEGARKQATNRWNSFGTPLLYTSESPALCGLELSKIIHPGFSPKNYKLLEIEIPDFVPLEIDDNFFRKDWQNDITTTQMLGDYFIDENKFLILKVPSIWIYNCFNYLINPNHSDFKSVRIINNSPFEFKGKLFDNK